MKPRKSIHLEISLPTFVVVPKAPGFKRFLADAATKLLRETCDEAWGREKFVHFMKLEERKRRQAYQERVATFKAIKAEPVAPSPSASPASPASAEARPAPLDNDSKKAPIATPLIEGEKDA